ncbi:MAG: serine hydroxymethyltransferase, partial [Abditibacteriota bacterium]|nr:serine hydroxymethyltransferase [Abditibacteriota bacterium]
ELFGADHANVQPHCGSSANMAVYFAFLKPGDTYMSMSLDQGGHLTHGSKVNFSGKLYNPSYYGVDPETEVFDYDAIEKQALEVMPKLIVTGATVYPRYIDFERFRKIADKVGALLMADIAHIAGLVAAGEHPSPVPYCDAVSFTMHKTLRGPRSGLILCKEEHAKAIDKAVFPGMQGGPLEHVIAAKAVALKEAMSPEFREYQKQIKKNAVVLAETLSKGGLRLCSGGTDNHLMLVDLTPMGLTGKAAQEVLDDLGIVLNKNMIPYDKQKPTVTSGVRIGTPCVTTRGMKEPEMVRLGEMIVKALKNVGDSAENAKAREEVAADVLKLTSEFPVYA